MRRKLLSLGLALIMVLSLCPTPARAGSMYALSFTDSEDKDSSTGNYTDNFYEVKGTWSWDSASKTLTLSGAEITGPNASGLYFNCDATVYLAEGTVNTIIVGDGALEASGHTLTVTGGGTLDIQTSRGFRAVGADNFIMESGNVTVRSNDDAIEAANVTVNGGNISISVGSIKSADNSSLAGTGIFCTGTLDMTGGSLTINTTRGADEHGQPSDDGNGILTYDTCPIRANDMRITGGRLRVTDPDAQVEVDMCNVSVRNALVLKNCAVELIAGNTNPPDPQEMEIGIVQSQRVEIDAASVLMNRFSIERRGTDPAPDDRDNLLFFSLKNVQVGKYYVLTSTDTGTDRVERIYGNITPATAGQTPLTEAMFTVDTSAAAYTGQPIAGRVSSASLREGTDYTVSYSNNTDVGTATVTVTGAGSYTGTLTYTFPITKADLPAETARQTVKKQVPMAEATTGNRVDIGALLPENRGETTYTAVSGGNIYLQNVQVGADGILTYDTAPAAAPTTVTITVTAEMARYSDAVVEISVELVDGIPIEITGVQAADASYNGSAHAGYTGTPAAAGYSGGFTYTYAGQDAAVLTAAPVDAGSYTVTIRPDTDGYLGERVLSFTVRKAVITGTPTCDTVQSAVGLRSVGLYPPAGGFRLGNTGAVVDGQLTWVEDRTIEQGTAFGWVFTPTGTVSNYEQKSGFLIPWPAAVNPSRPSGGSGSSGKPQETTTTTNADGSITRTVTDKATGTITETTTEKNGTKTVVETKGDGTVTTTVSIGERAGSRVVLPVETPRDSTVKITGVRKPTYVRIPVQRITGGTVAVLVSGGAERILPAAVSSGEGLTLRIDSGVTLRITDNSKVFQDVPGGHWAQDAVNFVSSRELFNGTAPAVFTPAAPMTRQMLMTVLARLDGEDTSGDAYGKGMAWAVGKGISDGSNPTGTISREQLAAMLYRYAGASAVQGDLSRFTDSEKVSGYAVDAVRWAVEQGILTGKAGDLLDPAGPATRAEVATMLYRYILSMY